MIRRRRRASVPSFVGQDRGTGLKFRLLGSNPDPQVVKPLLAVRNFLGRKNAAGVAFPTFLDSEPPVPEGPHWRNRIIMNDVPASCALAAERRDKAMNFAI